MNAVALRVGPLADGTPGLEFVLDDGTIIIVDLSVTQATQIAERIREVLNGTIRLRPPSRRVLEVPLDTAEEAPVSGVAVVPHLDTSIRTQGAFP